LANYLETAFSKFLPEAIKEAVSKSDLFVGQDFVAMEEAVGVIVFAAKQFTTITTKVTLPFIAPKGKHSFRSGVRSAY
jgi:hypothetical protein